MWANRLVAALVVASVFAGFAHAGEAPSDPAEAARAAMQRAFRSDDHEAALKFGRQALKLREAAFGERSAEAAVSRLELAVVLAWSGKRAESVAQRLKAVAIAEEVGGETHPLVAPQLLEAGRTLLELQKYAQAHPHLDRAVRLIKARYGDVTAEHGAALAARARARGHLGRVEEASADYAAAADRIAKALGPDHMLVANIASEHAEMLVSHRRWREAVAPYRRVLAVLARHAGEVTPAQVDGIRMELAKALGQSGEEAAAAELLEAVVASVEGRGQAAERDLLMRALNVLAVQEDRLGRTAQAEARYRRVLSLQRKASGPGSPETAPAMNNLAMLLKQTGRLSEAHALYSEALGILEKARGPNHPDVAVVLDNLANLEAEQGRYGSARARFERARAILEAARGADDVSVATNLSNTASLLRLMGDPAAAVPMMERAITILEAKLGPSHPRLAVALDNLASALGNLGRHAEATKRRERALAILRAAYGEDHPDVAMALHNLGWALRAQGDARGAAQMYRRALAINRKVRGELHPQVALNLQLLAAVQLDAGDLKGARASLKRSLKINRKLLGAEHPRVASNLMLMAETELAAGKAKKARRLAMKGLALVEEHLEPLLYATSERERLQLVAAQRDSVDLGLSLAGARGGREAYETVLRWKAVVLSSLVAQREGLRGQADEATRAKLAELGEVRTSLATAAFAVPDPEERETHASKLAELARRKQALERELSAASGEFRERRALMDAGFDEVCAALAEDTALVDYVKYVRSERSEGGRIVARPAYVAFVVRGGACKAPVRVELGGAEAVEEAVTAFREAVEKRAGPAVTVEKAAAVRKRVWDPVEGALDGRRTVWLAPDAALQGVPLAALPSGEDLVDPRFLVERYTFSTVATARDVLRWSGRKAAAATEATHLVVGGVDYEGEKSGQLAQVAQAVAPTTRAAGCGAGSLPRYGYLPGTKAEAEQVLTALGAGHNVALTGGQASEPAIRRALQEATHVHLATHGFFAKGCHAAEVGPSGARGQGSAGAAGDAVVGMNPLLLSGIVLAGANTSRKRGARGDDDGILTAEEVAGLDLSKLQLAVLSACETGLGDVETGQGVLGLRWAFTVAGAGALVMSLWQVPDEATRRLMTGFYDVLEREPELDKASALRRAQVRLLRKMRREGAADPWAWGAFIVTGR